MPENIASLKDTTWLSQKLNLSLSTIERWRRKNPSRLPPHIVIGTSTIRYVEADVNAWLTTQSQTTPNTEPENIHDH
ncbi:MAG: helix-turn-helix transcriptional regulator [Methylobacter sp.]